MIGRGGSSYRWKKTFPGKWGDDEEDGINRIYLGNGTEESLVRAEIPTTGVESGVCALSFYNVREQGNF